MQKKNRKEMLDGKKQTFGKMRMRKITEQQMFLFSTFVKTIGRSF